MPPLGNKQSAKMRTQWVKFNENYRTVEWNQRGIFTRLKLNFMVGLDGGSAQTKANS